MIWCRFNKDGQIAFGIVEGDMVAAVEGSPFEDWRHTGKNFALTDVELLVPVLPGTFYAGGINYLEHIDKMYRRAGLEPVIPTVPEIGYRSNNALLAHEGEIVKPADSSDAFEYEAELVVVFGKKARNVSREEAMDCVFGYTIGNDISERTWHKSDRTMRRSKNADTFKPMGPWIVTGLDPADMHTRVWLNGEKVEDFDTGAMVFDVPAYIAEISRYATIYPGDVLWMGTDGLPQQMKPGDLVEIEISGIGTLRNRVVAGT